MERFLLKVIDETGGEILTDKQFTGKTHYDSFEELSKMVNVTFTTRNREKMALQLASEKQFITIFNIKVGYIFVLPENCSEGQIDYLEKSLSLYQEEEKKDKRIEVVLFSKESVYYNHAHYRDLITEEKIDMLEGKRQEKSLVTDLLKEELSKQKDKLKQI